MRKWRTYGRVVGEPSAVAAYRRALPGGETFAFPIDPLDRLGVPVWSAELRPEDGGTHHGVGYGSSDDRAVISAFGELSEAVAAEEAMGRLPRREGSYRELLAELGPEGVIDPLAACLPAGADYTPEKTLRWVEARRRATGEPVLVPIELAAASPADVEPGEARLFNPVTNGLGAGPSLEHALAHGLLELVQRDGNSVNYRALDAGALIRLDRVEDPESRSLLDRFEREGVEIQAKLAATDFGMTNLYVVGAERDPDRAPHPLALTGCGEAAHPDREVALGKALREFCASRARKLFDHGPLEGVAAVAPEAYAREARRAATLEGEEDRALREMVGWFSLGPGEMRALIDDPVLAVRSEVAFSSLPTLGDTTEGLAELVAGRLREEGLDVLFVDLSPPGEARETRVVKAIVPGLEVETASYDRIGPRNFGRLLRRGDGLVGLGDAPEGARRVLLPEAARERLGARLGERPWLDVAALRRTVGRLYPLYREPSRHVTPLVAEGAL